MRRYNFNLLSTFMCISFLMGGILGWNNHAFAKETDFEKAMRIGLGEQRWNDLVKTKGDDFSKWRFGLFERHGVVLEAIAGWRMGNGYFAMERGEISSQDEFNRLWSSLTTAIDRSTRSTVIGIGIIGDWVNAIRGVSSMDSYRAERVLRDSGYRPIHDPTMERGKWVTVKPLGSSKYIPVRIVQQGEDWNRVVNEIQNAYPAKRVLMHAHGGLGGSAQGDMHFASALAASAGFDILILPNYKFRWTNHLYDTAHAAKWTMEGIAKFNKSGIMPSFTGFSAGAQLVVKMGQLVEKGKIWTGSKDIIASKDIRDNFYLDNVVTFAYPFSNAPFGNVKIPHELRGRIKCEITNFVSEKGDWSNYLDGATNIQLLGHLRTPHGDWNRLEDFKDLKRVEILSLALQGKPEDAINLEIKKFNERPHSFYKGYDDPSKKYYRIRKDFPPPWDDGGGGGGAAVPVGGVYLDMPADIVGLNTAEVSGAVWDDRENQLSLIVKGDVVSFPKTYLDDFVSVLMTVYGGEDPGISIDPGGYTNQCSVRYIGKIKNTRFGRILFEADRLLKSLSLGKDTLTGYPINPGIPGFKTMVELFEDYGMKYNGALYRFWFVPSEMKLKQHENSFVFDKARLEVKTEYMFKKGKLSETEPAAKAFAQFLTEHYDEFAYRYPVLKDLVEYAKMVSVAQWLKERNVPLNWFLLANSRVEDIPTPDVTPAMFSEHPRYPFEVWGGVDFRITNEYLSTTVPLPVVSEAALAKYSIQFTDVPVWNVGDTSWDVAGVSPGKRFELKDEIYTAVGMPSTTMETNGRKLVFQTDAVMHSSPRLELTRYYNADKPQPSQFGYGWSLLIPYKLEPTDDKRVTYQDVSLPERMTVIDLINNKKEVLKFEGRKYINVGYFPEKQEQFKGLLLMSDASFQLVDRWDNSFQFDQAGRLMVVDMGVENKWFYVYEGEKIIGIVNEEGSEIGFEYGPNGRIEKAIIANKGAIKGEVSYVYDTKGDLVKVVGMDGKATDYQYNNRHMLLSLIPKDAEWKKWQFIIVCVLGLTFGVGIFLTYRKRL